MDPNQTSLPNGPVAALVADIVRSRDYPDQLDLFHHVAVELNWINARLQPLGALAFTVGDELQGVLPTAAAAIEASLFLQLRLAGTCGVRCGIGWGEVTVQRAVGDYRGQTGSAWRNARAALDQVARSERSQGWPRTLRTWIEGLPEDEARWGRALLLCRDEIASGLDETEVQIALGLIEGKTQTQIAAAVGITQSSVAHRIARAGLHALLRSADSLREGAP